MPCGFFVVFGNWTFEPNNEVVRGTLSAFPEKH
jgi:hypothetical protein